MKKYLIALMVLMQSLMTGCSYHTVPEKPEAVIVERTSPPYPGAAWVDNEYRWEGQRYVVVPGHWVKAAGVWVPGHWLETRRGFRWVPGHWK